MSTLRLFHLFIQYTVREKCNFKRYGSDENGLSLEDAADLMG